MPTSGAPEVYPVVALSSPGRVCLVAVGHENFFLLIELLAAVTAVAIVARRLQVPYGTALVVAGLVLGVWRVVPHVEMHSEIVLGLFLPILLFEAAINTDATHLREDLTPVGLLSTVGFFTMAGVSGAAIHFLLGASWPVALLMGVMFSITDTVAVLAVFKTLKVPTRLATLMEGESLFNDGTALVLFKVMLVIAATGVFHPAATALEIVVVSVGGLIVGGLLGLLASWVMREAPDHLAEISLSVLLAIGTYFLAERLHVSGVIAVVMAGLVVGNYGWKRALAPSSQIAMGSFWEYAAFGVNSLVFLLVGLNIQLGALIAAAGPILACLTAILVGRAAAIYLGFPLLSRLGARPVPLGWQHVMVWGNMKGSLTMVLALSLPASIPERGMILTVTFGVVLISLVVQGLTLGPVMRALHIAGVSGLQRCFEEQQMALIRARAAQHEIAALADAGILSKSAYERMRARYQVTIARAERELRRLGTENQAHMDAALAGIRKRVLHVEKAAVIGAIREGLVSQEIAEESIEEINSELVATERLAPPDSDGGLLPDVGPWSAEAARAERAREA